DTPAVRIFGTSTAAAPNLSVDGDSNTGAYRPAADHYGITGGGVGVLVDGPGSSFRAETDGAVALGEAAIRYSAVHSQKLVTKTTASGYAGSDARVETANLQTTDASVKVLWQRDLVAGELLS